LVKKIKTPTQTQSNAQKQLLLLTATKTSATGQAPESALKSKPLNQFHLAQASRLSSTNAHLIDAKRQEPLALTRNQQQVIIALHSLLHPAIQLSAVSSWTTSAQK
jgi:hypothetical protein